MFLNAPFIRQARTERGWTQQQLAEIAGLSLRTIQRIENQSQGSMESCNALCAVLAVERQQLLSPPAPAATPLSRRFWAAMLGAGLAGFLCGVGLMLAFA